MNENLKLILDWASQNVFLAFVLICAIASVLDTAFVALGKLFRPTKRAADKSHASESEGENS